MLNEMERDVANDLAMSLMRAAMLLKVYPGYLAVQIKKLLQAHKFPEEVITDISDCETLGDCRYAITATDFNGTRYRITVEVEPDPALKARGA